MDYLSKDPPPPPHTPPIRQCGLLYYSVVYAIADEGKSLLPADEQITTLHIFFTLKQIVEIMYRKVCSLSVAGFLTFVSGFSSILHAQVFVAQKFKAVPNFRSTTAPIRLLSAKSQSLCALLCTLEKFCLGFNYRSSGGRCELLSAAHGEEQQEGWTFGYLMHLDNGE